MPSHASPALIAFALLLGTLLAVLGGAFVGAPRLNFRLRNLFMTRRFELSTYGDAILRLEGFALVALGSVVAGTGALAAGDRATGIGGGLAVFAVGLGCAWLVRRRYDRRTEPASPRGRDGANPGSTDDGTD